MNPSANSKTQKAQSSLVKVRYFKRPKNGLVSEVDVSKPHVFVPKDNAVVLVSPELAFRLVREKMAEVVEETEVPVQKAEHPRKRINVLDDGDGDEGDGDEE